MQRILLCLILCFIMMAPIESFSQNDPMANNSSENQFKHSISLSYAYRTPDYLMDGYKPGRPTTFDYTNKGNPGALCISYQYNFEKRTYIGLTTTIEQQHGDWLDNEIPYGNVFNLQTSIKGAFIRTCVTLGANITYDYISRGIFREYLVFGLGVTKEFETDQYNPDFYELGYQNGVNYYGPMRSTKNRTHITGYFSPFGISVGRKLNYFLELGFGYRGVINTGITYGFNTKCRKK